MSVDGSIEMRDYEHGREEGEDSQIIRKLSPHSYSSPVRVRIVNLNRLKRDKYRLQFELTSQDSEYEKMKREMKMYYSLLEGMETLKPFQIELLVVGELIVVETEIGFKRAKFIRSMKDTEKSSYLIVILIDEASPQFAVRCDKVYNLIKSFNLLSPRKQYFGLMELQSYEKEKFYQQLLCSCVDFFLGEIDVQFVEETFRGGEEELDPVVLIVGPKYPTSIYPLGLNGLIFENLKDLINEPALPDVNCRRYDAIIVGGDNDGNVFISFETPMYNHFMGIIARANKSSKLSKVESNSDKSVYENEIYLAPYLEETIQYYRVKRVSSSQASDTNMVTVCYIDFGTIVSIPVRKLKLARDIDPWLNVFPPQAIKVHLAGVVGMTADHLHEVVDFTELLYLKTLCESSSTALAEVVAFRLQDNENVDDLSRSLNGKIITSIGWGLTPRGELVPRTALLPVYLENDISNFINTKLIFWNGLSEPIKMLTPLNDFMVRLIPTVIGNRIESIIMCPPKRTKLLVELESDMLKCVPWKMKSDNSRLSDESPTSLKKYMKLYLREVDAVLKVVRVRVLANWETLEEWYNTGMLDNKVKVYLLDYGITKEVFWHQLQLLDERFLIYPPFAVQVTIEHAQGLSLDQVDAEAFRHYCITRTHNVTVLSLTWDSFDIPHAVVKVHPQDIGLSE